VSAPSASGGPSRLAIDDTRTGVAFWVHVTPGARRACIGGVHGDALRGVVRSRPVEGQANADCARTVAKALGVPPADVDVPPGSRGRRKRVEVTGPPGALRARLLSLADARTVR